MDPALPEVLQKALEAGPWPFVAVVAVLLLKKDMFSFFAPKTTSPDQAASYLLPIVVLLGAMLEETKSLTEIQTKIYERILLDGRTRGG